MASSLARPGGGLPHGQATSLTSAMLVLRFAAGPRVNLRERQLPSPYRWDLGRVYFIKEVFESRFNSAAFVVFSSQAAAAGVRRAPQAAWSRSGKGSSCYFGNKQLL